jgi:hypothetical protein
MSNGVGEHFVFIIIIFYSKVELTSSSLFKTRWSLEHFVFIIIIFYSKVELTSSSLFKTRWSLVCMKP